jgi:hypothetical protein
MSHPLSPADRELIQNPPMGADSELAPTSASDQSAPLVGRLAVGEAQAALSDEDMTRSYQLYSSLMQVYGEQSPQHQGLTAEDFRHALIDTAVSKTAVETDGPPLYLPQLGPVDRNEWLNPGFYEHAFPEEYSRGGVLHYVDLPGVQPGAEVLDRLSELAGNDGVVVFDYPMTDPDYPERVRAALESAGAEVAADIEHLGNQTYFAAQTHLKRKAYPLPEPDGFEAAFDEMVADGSFSPARFENGASIRRTVDEQQAAHLLKFYEEAYEVLSDSPAVQGINPKEFHEMMTEREWVTKVVRNVGGKIVALCMLDNHLEELSWVNVDYYARKYPRQYAKGQVMWFPGLANDPESGDVGKSLMKMVNLLAEVGERANNDILIVFDSCDHNTGRLDTGLDFLINHTKQASVTFETIAVQRYCAMRTRLKK